jgi:hypothetical protein
MVRALVEEVLLPKELQGASILEPCAGEGHIVRVLEEYGFTVKGQDVHDYGCGYGVQDLFAIPPQEICDWVITNPPFKKNGILRTAQAALPLAKKAWPCWSIQPGLGDKKALMNF